MLTEHTQKMSTYYKNPSPEDLANYNSVEANFPQGSQDPFKGDFRVTGSLNLDPLLKEARKLRDESQKKDVIMKHTIPQVSSFVDDNKKRKVVEESKKMIENFKENLSNYPKYLSYEGSMVICVMLSMNREVNVPLISLPRTDQTLIGQIVGNDYGLEIKNIYVRFDKNKNFICFASYPDKNDKKFELINTVAYPRPDDLKDVTQGTVAVEEKEGTINVGGSTIVLDKKRLANLAQLPSRDDYAGKPFDSEPQSILKTTNKNAFELRTDILKMAVEWSLKRDMPSEDDVLIVAKKFYSFVEDRGNRR